MDTDANMFCFNKVDARVLKGGGGGSLTNTDYSSDTDP